MGFSSAVLRRWISSSGALRSRGGVTSYEPPSAPRLLQPPATIDESGNIAYRSRCLANNEELTHTNNIGQLPRDTNVIDDVVFVGSSHGWLALYNRRNYDLFLSNPIPDRHIKLPTLGAVDRAILSSSLSSSSDEREEDEVVFTTCGSRRRVAFCSPRRSNEWTLLSGEDRDFKYDNLVYSTKHKRLFCISEEKGVLRCVLECWNVDQHTHTLDWECQLKEYERSEFKEDCCLQMKYLVSAEHSGELFVVVRHVSLRAGPLGSTVNKVILSQHRGCHYDRTPYKTIDFDVYKMDFERRAMVYMKDSLEGLAMFVGINHPFAIPAAGLKPNSVYFTDENRLVEPTRLERTSYGGHDNGIFDYRGKEIYACCDFYPIEFEKIRKILPLPLWFTPTPS